MLCIMRESQSGKKEKERRNISRENLRFIEEEEAENKEGKGEENFCDNSEVTGSC